VFSKDVPRTVELLADALQNSVYDAAEVEAEREVILGEIDAHAHDYKATTMDNLFDTAFQGSGLSRSVYGSAASVKALTRDQLAAFARTYYTAPRVVVSAAGAVQHAQVSELAEKFFGKLPSAPASGLVASADPVSFLGSEIRVREDTIPHAHMAIAFETGGWGDKHFFPLLVMQQLLGKWEHSSGAGSNVSSPLCRKAASEGTALSIKSFTSFFKDTGLLGVYVKSEPVTARSLMYTVMYELARLTNNVTDEEVARAKQQLLTSYLTHLANTAVISSNNGRQISSFGRTMSPIEVSTRLSAVDATVVRDTARVFIDDKDVAFSALGNVHETPDYNWLRRRTYWLRA